MSEKINDNKSTKEANCNTEPLFLDDKQPVRILLVRHGQSLGNAQRIYLGHTDLDLSEMGYMQAKCTADFLKDVKIDAVYSSSLIRAYNTALPHAQMRGLEVHSEDVLREIYLGKWEGLPLDVLHTEYKEQFFGEWTDNFGISCPPDGESVQAAAERFYARLTEIARAHIGKTVLVAAHAAVIRATYAKISDIPPERVAGELRFPHNASVSVVYFDGERLIPGEYSHSSHLGELA